MVNWFIQHAMEAFYPRTETLPGIADTDVRGFLRRYRREATGLMWLGLVMGTLVFVWTPLLTVGWPLPSFLLPRKTLDRHAHRITSSRLYLVRQAVFLVKLAAGLCWGAHPKVRERFAMAPYAEDPGTWRTT
ncbi:MAG: hypothetical protein VYE22_19560 [Myxococcota bacterium]|nr:hypothetical protein [Myxococcota bacterium]